MNIDSPGTDLSVAVDAEPVPRFPSTQDYQSDSPEFVRSLRSESEANRSDSAPLAEASRLRHLTDRKWNQVKRYYNDSYGDLLREAAAEDYSDGVPSINLGQTQVGAVTWYPREKVAFYQALSRKGRDNLPFIAQTIGTKSELEVRDYLLLLREKQAERHLYAKQTKINSHLDTPAAIEISAECEAALDQVADAQAAYEGYYERVTRLQKDIAAIDQDIAETLDEKADKLEDDFFGNEEDEEQPAFETPIFYLSKFIELSERIFMNQGQMSSHGTWHEFAMGVETPSFTQEVVSELYDLVVNFTRRLMQTSLFLAQSRQKATASSYYRHRAMVRDQDVEAAVDVLNLKGDLWEYWTGVARRNKLNVINDTHAKGSGYKSSKFMSYEAVEQNLSKRKKRWRGRRRMSSSTSNSTDVGTMEDDTGAEDTDGTRALSDGDESLSSGSASSSHLPHSRSNEKGDSDSEPDPVSSDASSDLSRSPSSSDSFSNLSFHTFTPGQKRRHIFLEQQQDAYLSDLDAMQSRREEKILWQMLGQDPPTTAKHDDRCEAQPIRPKVLRKKAEDLKDPFEINSYLAEWERFGGLVPAESFAETGHVKKKIRIVDEKPQKKVSTSEDTPEMQELPLRRGPLRGDSDIDSDPDFEV